MEATTSMGGLAHAASPWSAGVDAAAAAASTPADQGLAAWASPPMEVVASIGRVERRMSGSETVYGPTVSNRPANLPDFERPPLVEVNLGIEFGALRPMRAAHVGLFWSCLL